MHILLPPSETKRPGGGSSCVWDELPHRAELDPARRRIRVALEALCADPDTAAAALKLGAKSRGELAHNRELGTSGSLPAIERYTGVLYDALAPDTLDAPSRSWLDAHVSVQSALFGLLPADARIPAYRLSASTRLPGLGAPLKRVWREAHDAIDWAAFGWILDLRSKDYAELAPLPRGRGTALDVLQRTADGGVRALNHFNKAAKGDLVRRLAQSRAQLDGPEAFIAWGAAHGLEIVPGDAPERVSLITELGAPAGSGTRRAAR